MTCHLPCHLIEGVVCNISASLFRTEYVQPQMTDDRLYDTVLYVWLQHTSISHVLSSFQFPSTLQWPHNGRDGVSNHQPHHWLLNRLYRHRSKKTSKLRVTGLSVCRSKKISKLRVIGLCVYGEFTGDPHKWPVTRKMIPFDDVIMKLWIWRLVLLESISKCRAYYMGLSYLSKQYLVCGQVS